MRNYLILFAGFIIVIAALMIFCGGFLFPNKIDSVSWGLYLYFIFVTLLFHVGLVKYSQGRPQSFIRYYMGSTTLKLLLHMGIIVMYAFFNQADAVRFIVSFLIFYLLFTSFEVGVVWKQFRKNN